MGDERDMNRLQELYEKTKDPAERQSLKSEMDSIPVSSSDLSQAMEREATFKAAEVKKFQKKVNG